MELHFGSRVVRHALPQPAYGLSRYALDRLLLDRAAALGAEVVRETRTPRAARRPLVLANGRTAQGRTGERLFGFKAHYRGAVDDTVALFFFDGCYVGVSAVEGGEINICGLASRTAAAGMRVPAGAPARRAASRCSRACGHSSGCSTG